MGISTTSEQSRIDLQSGYTLRPLKLCRRRVPLAVLAFQGLGVGGSCCTELCGEACKLTVPVLDWECFPSIVFHG